MSKKLIVTFLIPLLLTACFNKHEEQKKQLRHEVRSQFYARQLQKAQRQLAHTDSLLQLAEADSTSLDAQKRIHLDSLRKAADVQGAQIRYIHKKQGELKEME